jgi:hypothetical protein
LLEIRVGPANVRSYLDAGSVAPTADVWIEPCRSDAGESAAIPSACGGRSIGRAPGAGVAPPERAGGLTACALPALEPGVRTCLGPRVLA